MQIAHERATRWKGSVFMIPNSTCSCSSDNQRTSNREVALHVPGLQGLEKPSLIVFPKVQVCLNCGVAAFVMEDADLKSLRENYSSIAA
jgi:hypothetical protein